MFLTGGLMMRRSHPTKFSRNQFQIGYNAKRVVIQAELPQGSIWKLASKPISLKKNSELYLD